MSNYRVQQAVAAALTLGSVAIAHAAQVDITTVGVANTLYVSGSTAIDAAMTSYWINGATSPCSTAASDPAPTFYASTSTGKKFQAVACTASAGLVAASGGTITAGTAIAVIKEDNGGSQFGIDPVRDNTGLALTGQTVASFFPDITTMTVAACTGTNGALAPAPTANTCNTTIGTVSTAPNLGFADVDPAMFQDSIGTATSFNTIVIPFAAAVSLGLDHELQTLQGLIPAGSTTACDTAACMPILTKDQLTALYTGQVGNWATLFPAIATTQVTWGTTGGTQFNAGLAVPAAGTSVYICQRGQSSGTERTAEIFFANQNCAGGVNKFAPAAPVSCQTDGCSWSTTFNNNKNFAGNGTGDLLTCLQGQDKVGHLAIGFASIDNGWGPFQGNTARKDFRYVRYNDAVPSIENAAAGLYSYWAQSVGVIPAASNANTASGVAGAIASWFDAGANRIGSATSLANLNASHQFQNGGGVAATTWDGGILGIAEAGVATPNATTVALTSFEANPVATASKFVAGVTNNCAPAVATSLSDTSAAPAWQAPALF